MIKRSLAMFLFIGVLFMWSMEARAETKGVLTWTHDSDELFVVSHARTTIKFRCRWDGPDGWSGRTGGRIDPGQELRAYTLFGRDARAFECWRRR